jgi:hypothetical protein
VPSFYSRFEPIKQGRAQKTRRLFVPCSPHRSSTGLNRSSATCRHEHFLQRSRRSRFHINTVVVKLLPSFVAIPRTSRAARTRSRASNDFDALIWPHLTENRIPCTPLRAQWPQGRPGGQESQGGAIPSRSDVSMSMVVERFEGSPRSWGFIGGWCVRRCLVRFQ